MPWHPIERGWEGSPSPVKSFPRDSTRGIYSHDYARIPDHSAKSNSQDCCDVELGIFQTALPSIMSRGDLSLRTLDR
jgi:hypothetical protein